MTRINLFLLAVAILSAMSVINARHLSRKLYSELHKEQKFAADLEIEYGRLQLEQSTWAAQALIEEAATTRLHMQIPHPRDIQIIQSNKRSTASNLPLASTPSGSKQP